MYNFDYVIITKICTNHKINFKICVYISVLTYYIINSIIKALHFFGLN